MRARKLEVVAADADKGGTASPMGDWGRLFHELRIS
jgi:hypothetical protein